MFPLISLATHHGESDPELMLWIKHLLDQIFGLGPWAVVLALGALMVGLPLAVAVAYLLQRKEKGFLPPIHSGDNSAGSDCGPQANA